MITRRSLATNALAGAGLMLAGCGPGPDSGGRAAGEVRFAILSAEAAQTLGRYWAPILADMSAQTGLKVSPYVSASDAQLIEAMRLGKTDLGWFSSLSGLEAVRRAGGEVFARTFDPSGQDGYSSVLIVAAKSRITLADVLECNRRLTLGLGDALSISGTLAPETYLFAPKGVDPQTCFKTVRGGASHQNNLFAVAAGQLDVASNNSTSLRLNRQQGRHEADRVRVIWTSPELPGDPILWRKALDPAIKEKLRQFFLTYGQGDTSQAVRQRGFMARINVGGFRPADDTFLLPAREMEATRNWLLAKEGGDAAKIAAARDLLDDITARRIAFEARTRAPAAAQ